MTKWLCREETTACTKAAPKLPKGRKPGPAFKVVDQKELDMQRMMASMQVRTLCDIAGTKVWHSAFWSNFKVVDHKEQDMQRMMASMHVGMGNTIDVWSRFWFLESCSSTHAARHDMASCRCGAPQEGRLQIWKIWAEQELCAAAGSLLRLPWR